MKQLKIGLMFAVCFLSGCGNTNDHTKLGVAATRISGFVWLDGYPSSGEVKLYKYEDFSTSKSLVRAVNLTKDGRFTMEAGSFSGAAHLEVSLSGGAGSLSTDIADVTQFSSRENIAITAVTHLAAGYADFLFKKRGIAPHEAITAAKLRVYDHFGALSHDWVQPWTEECEHGGSGARAGNGAQMTCEQPKESASLQTIYEPVQVRLYLDAFKVLANQLREEAEPVARPYITLSLLLKRLYDDISSDGVFDGAATAADIMGGGKIRLAPDLLRGQLSRAFRHAVSSHSADFDLGPEAFERAAIALTSASSELFASAQARDLDGSREIFCFITTDSQKIRDLSFPHGGIIHLECRWPHTSIVHNPAISFCAENNKESLAVESLTQPRPGSFVAKINTRRLTELSDAHTFRFDITAEDEDGVDLFFSDLLWVQNITAPLEIEPPRKSGRAGEKFSIRGKSDVAIESFLLTARDPTDEASVQQLYTSEKFFDFGENTQSFAAEVNVPCAANLDVRLTVKDWAGNTALRSFTYHCMNHPPSLQFFPSVFQGDGENTHVLIGVEGEIPQLVKEYNKLDHILGTDDARTIISENLPTFNIVVANAQGTYGKNTPFGDLKVSYRYSLEGESKYASEWNVLPEVIDGEVYHFPISYQTLLPQALQDRGFLRASEENFIATCMPDKTHTLEFQVEDAVGNTTRKKIQFTLLIKAPRVELDRCQASGALRGASITNSSMGQVLSRGFDLYEARLSFPLRLHQQSLAPRDPLSITLAGGDVRVHVGDVLRSYQQISKDEFPAGLRDKLVDRFRRHICGWHGCRYFEGDEAVGRPNSFLNVSEVAFQHAGKEQENLEWNYVLAAECYDDHGEKVVSRHRATGELFPDRVYLCRFKVDSVSTSSKRGHDIDWDRIVLDAQQRHGIYLNDRLGVEEGNFGEGWKRRYYRETTSIGALTFAWQPEVPAGGRVFTSRRLHVPLGLSAQCSTELEDTRFTVDAN